MSATIDRAEARRRADELQAPLEALREPIDRAKRQHHLPPSWVSDELDRIHAELLELRDAVDRLDEEGGENDG